LDPRALWWAIALLFFRPLLKALGATSSLSGQGVVVPLPFTPNGNINWYVPLPPPPNAKLLKSSGTLSELARLTVLRIGLLIMESLNTADADVSLELDPPPLEPSATSTVHWIWLLPCTAELLVGVKRRKTSDM
jgi:hypothetical protein